MKRLGAADPALANSEACNFCQGVDLTGNESPQMKRFLRSEVAAHQGSG